MSGRQDELADQIAVQIWQQFVVYRDEFASITRRAPLRFERREWALHQIDARQRLRLHGERVRAAVERCSSLLETVGGARRRTWRSARAAYAARIAGRDDFDLAETFFNSVTRRVFNAVGHDNDLEFRWFGPTTSSGVQADAELFTSYRPSADGSVGVLTRVLEALPLVLDDAERDGRLIAEALARFLVDEWETDHFDTLDVLTPLFYRNKGAYLIGRVRYLNRVTPFVLPLLQGDDGVFVDTVLLEEGAVSRLFGVTRSYFHAEWPVPSDVVGFLKSMLPMKASAELYTSLGFNQHGKTLLYRSLYRHLSNSTGKFEFARGTKGMVMTVFTLPSFDVVFKIIKDRFDPPKRCTREQVMDKYRLVFEHDRVGRMVDAQEFENLAFPVERFTPELLDELLTAASNTVELDGEQVIIRHLYTERKLYPLDLYLREMGAARVRAAALDYGAAIRDLAVANIFPGDLFAKNFGVTRHGSVVFYDYDELCLLGDCRFRELPDAGNDDDEMRSQPWFSVDPDDVFPEEFERFMWFPGAVRDEARGACESLFTVAYWRGLQDQHESGIVPDFYPYDDERRFGVARTVADVDDHGEMSIS